MLVDLARTQVNLKRPKARPAGLWSSFHSGCFELARTLSPIAWGRRKMFQTIRTLPATPLHSDSCTIRRKTPANHASTIVSQTTSSNCGPVQASPRIERTTSGVEVLHEGRIFLTCDMHSPFTVWGVGSGKLRRKRFQRTIASSANSDSHDYLHFTCQRDRRLSRSSADVDRYKLFRELHGNLAGC